MLNYNNASHPNTVQFFVMFINHDKNNHKHWCIIMGLKQRLAMALIQISSYLAIRQWKVSCQLAGAAPQCDNGGQFTIPILRPSKCMRFL